MAGTQRMTWAGALVLAAATLSGCELAAVMAGHGEQKELFKIPPTAKVLVLVDPRPEVSAPPSFATNLAEKIGAHIFRNHGVEQLVGQAALIDLQREPARFRQMGVKDIADATGADIVIVVNLLVLNVTSTTDGTVSQGAAQAYVKVVGKDGSRLWPGETAGYQVPEITIQPAFTSERDKSEIYKKMMDLLEVRVGRIFHKYDLEDKTMIK